MWEKSVLGRRNDENKGPEEEPCGVCLRNSKKTSVTKLASVRGRLLEHVVRETAQGKCHSGPCWPLSICYILFCLK